jgi:hypothetical protein
LAVITDMCADAEQRILAARNIAAGGVDRHVPVAQHHAGHGLDFHVLHGIALDLRKVAHLRLRELDVLALLRGQAVHRGVDLGLAQAVVVAVPPVETNAHLAHGRIAPRFDAASAASTVSRTLRSASAFASAVAPRFRVNRHQTLHVGLSLQCPASRLEARPSHSFDAKLSMRCRCAWPASRIVVAKRELGETRSMRLATLQDGTPDGRLVVVSPDGRSHAPAPVGTLQAALEQWTDVAPQLAAITMFSEPLDPAQVLAPAARVAMARWLGVPVHGDLMDAVLGIDADQDRRAADVPGHVGSLLRPDPAR